MQVHPDIAALRSDPALQRRISSRMRAAQEAWLNEEGTAAIASGLSAYAGGEELREIAALQSVLTDHACASDFVAGFSRAFAQTLRDEPLGEVPMQHRSSASYARLQIMRSGSAILSLCVYEPVAKQRVPRTAQFVDCAADEIVIEGSATGYLHSLKTEETGKSAVASSECQWRAGDRISLCAQSEARHFVKVDQSLLILQLTRTSVHASPSREYRLSDGALLRQSSGDKRASEELMALAVLGALGDENALVPMKEFACDTARDPDARWEAVRQILAMDSASGIKLLGRLVTNPSDPLAQPATSLRRQLLASQPAFRQLAMEA